MTGAENNTPADKPATPPPSTRSEALYFAFAFGMAVWSLTGAFTGHTEAWDSDWYYYAGMPLMMITAGILGYHYPKKAYRHGLWIALGEFAAMIVIGLIRRNGWGMLPLGLAMAYVLSVPLQLSAIVGGIIAKRQKTAA